jgi:hypothetical protein
MRGGPFRRKIAIHHVQADMAANGIDQACRHGIRIF